jgi:hypothetical protein
MSRRDVRAIFWDGHIGTAFCGFVTATFHRRPKLGALVLAGLEYAPLSMEARVRELGQPWRYLTEPECAELDANLHRLTPSVLDAICAPHVPDLPNGATAPGAATA